MKKILIIDADSLLYYTGFKDTEEEAKKELTMRLVEMCQQHSTDSFVGFLTDGSHRYEIATTKPYKGNRKTMEKPPHYEALREFATTSLKFETVKGMEADDLSVYWFNNFDKKDYEIVLCSPDKDVLLSVPGKHWNYKYVKLSETEVEKGRFQEVSVKDASLFPFKQCITGDSGDNIPGIKGVGPAKVDKLMESVKDTDPKEDLTDYGYKIAVQTFKEHFDIVEGMTKFLEMYRLVYILRNKNDVKRELGIELAVPTIRKISY